MCEHQRYSKGHKCYGNEYPAMMQGQYLPGDEPGFYCRELNDHCCMEDCPYGEEYWQSNCDTDDCHIDPHEEWACSVYVQERDERGHL